MNDIWNTELSSERMVHVTMYIGVLNRTGRWHEYCRISKASFARVERLLPLGEFQACNLYVFPERVTVPVVA